MSGEGKGTILIVDDIQENVLLLSEVLKMNGYTVLVAHQGEVALEKARTEDPDMILMDVRMPGMSGYDITTILKKDEVTIDIPVLFVTALSDKFDKLKGFKAGGVDYITKPFQIEEVLSRVKAHITIKKQKEKLKEMNKQLGELVKSKDRFFSIISHDLKNVFMNVPQLSKLLMESADEMEHDEIKEIAERCYEDSTNTMNLFYNLLNWSEVQLDRLVVQNKKIDLSEVVERSFNLLNGVAHQKEIILQSNVEKNTLIDTDENILYTVLRNIITNAIKFSNKGGKIEVTKTSDDSDIEIQIRDYGIGIDPNEIDDIFRIDVKYTKPGTEKEHGSGFGLILCNDLLQKCGGKIKIESEVGQGTKVKILLKDVLATT